MTKQTSYVNKNKTNIDIGMERIFAALAHPNGLELFRFVIANPHHKSTYSNSSKEVMIHLDITAKQYYGSLELLKSNHLVRRRNIGRELTLFGKTFADLMAIQEKALKNIWLITAIESLEKSNLSEEQLRQFVQAAIKEPEITDMIMRLLLQAAATTSQ